MYHCTFIYVYACVCKSTHLSSCMWICIRIRRKAIECFEFLRWCTYVLPRCVRVHAHTVHAHKLICACICACMHIAACIKKMLSVERCLKMF